MSLFDDQLAGGLAAIRQLAGDAVSYSNGTAAITVTATEGMTQYEALDAAGQTVTGRTTDFFVKVSDLPYEPEPGHRITKGASVYELMRLGEEPCWVYSDPGHTEYRIHTKLVT